MTVEQKYFEIGSLLSLPSWVFRVQATPEEIAYSCAFYCSDGGAYLNGTFLLQDGGLRDHSSDRAPVLEKIAADRAALSGPEV